MHKIIWQKFLGGIETYIFGVAVACAPDILNYSAHFDFTKLGLSPEAAHMIGGAIILIRMADSVGESPKVKSAKAEGLTGAEVAGPNAANR